MIASEYSSSVIGNLYKLIVTCNSFRLEYFIVYFLVNTFYIFKTPQLLVFYF